jgi:hypothetical protein
MEITRNDWRKVAQSVGAKSYEVEIACSDKAEHRRRGEARTADIENHRLQTWQDILERDYQPWKNVELR